MDEQFGAAILRDAADKGFHTACPAEKSGQDEFDFEYGEDFAQHIEEYQPDVLQSAGAVQSRRRCDANNGRQSSRLKRLSDYLAQRSRSLFMFELLVPAGKSAAGRVKGDKQAYDLELRPEADGRGNSRVARRWRRSRTCGKLKVWIAVKIARKSWPLPSVAGEAAWVASC